MLASIVFWVTAVIAVAGALGVVLFKQPIQNVLSLVVVMFALAVQFLLLSAEFVFVVQIIVYAGAVMVLFLFVVALLGPVLELRSTRLRYLPAVAAVFVVSLGAMVYSVLQLATYRKPTAGVSLSVFGSVESIAAGLFTTYLYPFELTSLLLLIAAVGAIYLSKRGSR